MLLIALQIFIIVLLFMYIKNSPWAYDIGLSLVPQGKTIRTPLSNYKYYYDLPGSLTLDGNKPNGTAIPWLNTRVNYTINSDGLNERYNYELLKPTKVCSRIITIGDSFTFGLYVDTTMNFTELLEDKLNISEQKKYEVINLGLYGYDIKYAIERYRLKGRKYNPDLIIFLLKDDDFIEDNEIKESIRPWLIKKMKKDGSYYNTTSVCKECVNLMKAMNHYNWVHGGEKLLVEKEIAIKQIRNYFSGKVLLVTFSQLNKRYKDILQKIVEYDKNMYLVYVTNTNLNPLMNFLPNDHHPNQKGHGAIAKNVYDYLMKNNLLPCQ